MILWFGGVLVAGLLVGICELRISFVTAIPRILLVMVVVALAVCGGGS